MAEACLVSLPVVEALDVVEEHGPELASGHGFPIAVDKADLALIVAHVASMVALSQHTPVLPNEAVTPWSIMVSPRSPDVY